MLQSELIINDQYLLSLVQHSALSAGKRSLIVHSQNESSEGDE
jgi:hypothetical protein